MKTLKHYFSVAAIFGKLAIQRQLEYPSFLVSWFLMIPLQYFAGIWMFKVLVDKFSNLNGWTFPEIAFIYGLALLSHGTMVVLFIPTWQISGMVVRGGFDRMLVRPMNIFFQCVSSYFNFIGLIDLIPGIIIFIMACQLVHFSFTLINIITILAIVSGAVLIRASFFTIMGSTAFFTRNSDSLVGVSLNILERTTMYPLTIYPYFVQVIFTFLIPFGFITFYPACDILQKETGIGLPLNLTILTPLIGLLLFYIANKFFSFGLKRYESAGN